MKKTSRYFPLFIFTSIILVASYFIGTKINDFASLDGFFTELTQPWIYHILGIKIGVMAVILTFSMARFHYILNASGLIVGNAATFAFLDYQRALSDQYWVYLIIFGLELLLIILLGAVFNSYLNRREVSKEKKSAKPLEKPEVKKVPVVAADEAVAVDEAEKPVPVRGDEDVAKMENLAADWKRETQSIPDPIPEEPPVKSTKKTPVEDTSAVKTAIEANPAKEPGASWPIRIDIDMEDLKRYIDQYNRLSGKEEGMARENAQSETQLKLDSLSKREQELKRRIAIVKSKEKIIEKTITNLEQISKTIKERTASLEEREEQVRQQVKKVQEREDDITSAVHGKIYDLFFDDLDTMENEVKLKDEKREIIIDRNDLSEIRRNIEETMEEARRGMEQ